MSKKKDVPTLVSAAGWIGGFVDKLVRELRELGVADEAIYQLVTDKGDIQIKKIAEELAKLMNVAKEADSELLDFVEIVEIPSTGKFAVDDHFTKDSKEVKIAWIGDNFRNNFSSKVEEAQAETTLRVSKLKKNSLDMPIIAELGSRTETTLANIWQMLKKQANGEFGKLLVNGCANIFYVRDAKAVLWAVGVDWCGDGWYVFARSVTLPGEWHEGRQVFSRHRTEAPQ